MSKVKGEEAAERFEVWAQTQPLQYFREITNKNRTQLVRTAIMDAVGIDRPALRQNRRIQKTLLELEKRLRTEGILIGRTAKSSEKPKNDSSPLLRQSIARQVNFDMERLNRLEREVVAKDAELSKLRPLRAENLRLQRLLFEKQEQLQHFRALEEALCESGRIPR